jgi:hypothetical protein
MRPAPPPVPRHDRRAARPAPTAGPADAHDPAQPRAAAAARDADRARHREFVRDPRGWAVLGRCHRRDRRVQYGIAQREDLAASRSTSPSLAALLHELRALPGVTTPSRSVRAGPHPPRPSQLRRRHRGAPPTRTCGSVVDRTFSQSRSPREGIVLTERLGRILRVGVATDGRRDHGRARRTRPCRSPGMQSSTLAWARTWTWTR